jgi:cell division protein FtsB
MGGLFVSAPPSQKSCADVDNALAASFVYWSDICNNSILQMRFLIVLRKIITNRYLLASAAFGVWILFFDKNDYYTQRQRTLELQELNMKIAYYQQQIEDTRKELQALQNDPFTLEKYAREKYYMKRANEEVFVVAPSK